MQLALFAIWTEHIRTMRQLSSVRNTQYNLVLQHIWKLILFHFSIHSLLCFRAKDWLSNTQPFTKPSWAVNYNVVVSWSGIYTSWTFGIKGGLLKFCSFHRWWCSWGYFSTVSFNIFINRWRLISCIAVEDSINYSCLICRVVELLWLGVLNREQLKPVKMLRF